MKNNKQEFLIILSVSIVVAFAIPIFFESKDFNGVVEDAPYILLRTFILFVCISLIYFAQKSRMVNILKGGRKDIIEGYHEFYNEDKKPIAKGLFEAGKLYDGTKYMYNKDGSLFCTETYKKGIRCDVKKEN